MLDRVLHRGWVVLETGVSKRDSDGWDAALSETHAMQAGTFDIMLSGLMGSDDPLVRRRAERLVALPRSAGVMVGTPQVVG